MQQDETPTAELVSLIATEPSSATENGEMRVGAGISWTSSLSDHE